MNHEFIPDSSPEDTYCKCGLHQTHHDHSKAGAIVPRPIDEQVHMDLMRRIEAILTEAGNFSQCKGCFSPLYWINGKGGKKIAYNPDGTSHFATCTRQHEFVKAGVPK